MNDNTFWLAFWSMAFIVIGITIISVTYLSYNYSLGMVNAGYSQKWVVVKPASPYNALVVDLLWVKEGTKVE